MAKEKAPAFQFYPREFLTDGNVAGMNNREVGAYWRLCCICWTEGSLPNDLKRLAAMVGENQKQFRPIWSSISICFWVSGDRLRHQRLDKERDKQAHYLDIQREKGNRSAAVRATKRQPDVNRGSTERQPDTQPTAKSPISDLRTTYKNVHTQFARARTETPPKTLRTDGVFAGSLPRDHIACAWCGGEAGLALKCVPGFIHSEFLRALGGPSPGAELRLKTFYEAVDLNLRRSEQPDGTAPPKFWRDQFEAQFPASSKPGTTPNVAAITAEIARQNAASVRR